MSGKRRTEWAYLLAILLPALTLWIRHSFGDALGTRPALIFFMIPITLCAFLGGLRPGMLCTLNAVLLSGFFSSGFSSTGKYLAMDIAQWVVFAATGLIISYLVERLLRSQERLSLNEARLSGMFQSAMDGMISVDESLTIVYINPAAEKMFGYRSDALPGTSARLLVPEAHRRLCARLVRHLSVNGALDRMVSGPVKGVRSNGEEFPVEATISRAESQGRPLFTMVIRDVSERKAAEDALREREALYRGLFESLDEGVLIYDTEGRIEACNGSAERILGRTSHEILGLHYSDIPWRPRNPDEAEFDPGTLAVASVQRTGQPVQRRERVLLRPDGTEIWTLQTAVPLGLNRPHETPKVIVSFTDITDSREKSAIISLMADIVANSRDAIISKDLTGTILTWNRGAEALTGYSAEEAIGHNAAQLLLRPEHHEAESNVRARIAQGESVRTFDIDIKRKDGQSLQAQVTVSPIRDASNAVVGASLVARDVTERRRIDDAIRERDAAELASRMKSEFLANMSHELRTPLNGIIGFTEYLKAGQAGSINEDQAESLDSIYKSSLHLLDLINDVLDLSKIEAGKMTLVQETFGVREVVEEVCGVVSPLAQKKRITLQQKVDGAFTTVTLDRAKFKQILYNLLSNAVKFTNDSGRVNIDLDALEGPRMRIRVTDTGIGINPGDIDKLFMNFHQLDNSNARRHEGTGMGLALTKKIVELQHGVITVESALGQGSVFTVTLPY